MKRNISNSYENAEWNSHRTQIPLESNFELAWSGFGIQQKLNCQQIFEFVFCVCIAHSFIFIHIRKYFCVGINLHQHAATIVRAHLCAFQGEKYHSTIINIQFHWKLQVSYLDTYLLTSFIWVYLFLFLPFFALAERHICPRYFKYWSSVVYHTRFTTRTKFE